MNNNEQNMIVKNKDAILKDLELQWQDHFHMRDQTWKTLSNTILLFLGIVGLEIKGIPILFLIPAYIALIITAFLGWVVASHHRKRQEEKFEIIETYEKVLGVYDLKKKVLLSAKRQKTFLDKIYTASFIAIMQLSLCIIALFLLLRLILQL